MSFLCAPVGREVGAKELQALRAPRQGVLVGALPWPLPRELLPGALGGELPKAARAARLHGVCHVARADVELREADGHKRPSLQAPRATQQCLARRRAAASLSGPRNAWAPWSRWTPDGSPWRMARGTMAVWRRALRRRRRGCRCNRALQVALRGMASTCRGTPEGDWIEVHEMLQEQGLNEHETWPGEPNQGGGTLARSPPKGPVR